MLNSEDVNSNVGLIVGFLDLNLDTYSIAGISLCTPISIITAEFGKILQNKYYIIYENSNLKKVFMNL